MRLSRIFIDQEIQPGSEIGLPPDKAHYVKHVLRLKNLNEIIIFNGREPRDYLAEIFFQGKQVSARVNSAYEKNNDSAITINLIQAIGKSEHMDFIIQKATELGINRFQLFNAQRTQSPLKDKRLEKKLNHWKGIAISACEQCNRNTIPEIVFAINLNHIITITSSNNRLILDFHGKTFSALYPELDPQKNFDLLVGCEGGFTEDEINLAGEHGFTGFSCGPRTLRMETSAISVVTIVQHHFGDMR